MGARGSFPGLLQHSEHADVSEASRFYKYVEDGFGLMAEGCCHKEAHSV